LSFTIVDGTQVRISCHTLRYHSAMTWVVCIVMLTSLQKFSGRLLTVIAKNRVLSASKNKEIQDKIPKAKSELPFS